MSKAISFGNVVLTGFVNHVDGNRAIVGTGSYTDKSGTKVFKESVTLFIDEKFTGHKPAKGDFVKVSGDLTVGPRKDNAELAGTINVRASFQLEKAEAPAKKATSDDSI